MLRHFLSLLIALTCLVQGSRAAELALVRGEGSPAYGEFAAVLATTLRGSDWRIAFDGEFAGFRHDKPVDLIVAVGSDALRKLLEQKTSAPILATLLPRSSYEAIIGEHENRRGTVSAIYLDHPASRQAAFVRQLLPGKQRFGLLLSNQTRHQAAGFRLAFNKAGLSLDSELVDNDTLLLPATEALLPRIEVLLSIPDNNLYKRHTIKPLLITAYRYQRPVIAFSAAFAKAGALAALYATPEQIGRQAGTLIKRFGARLPPPGGPAEFSITINQSVAEALGLRVPDETTVYRALVADGDVP